MKTFFHAQDLGDLNAALAEAQEVKRDRFQFQHLGKNKTLLMIFFNNSLRTRLSTQKAAMNLGMNVIVLDVNAGLMRNVECIHVAEWLAKSWAVLMPMLLRRAA